MPRYTLDAGDAVLQARDDRAMEVGRQMVLKGRDRRRTKMHSPHGCAGCGGGRRSMPRMFRRHRLGQPLCVSDDDLVMHPADGGADLKYVSDTSGRQSGTSFVGSLLDLAGPSSASRRVRRDVQDLLEFIIVPRPRGVIVLDDDEFGFEQEEFELVPRVQLHRLSGAERKRSFADVVACRN